MTNLPAAPQAAQRIFLVLLCPGKCPRQLQSLFPRSKIPCSTDGRGRTGWQKYRVLLRCATGSKGCCRRNHDHYRFSPSLCAPSNAASEETDPNARIKKSVTYIAATSNLPTVRCYKNKHGVSIEDPDYARVRRSARCACAPCCSPMARECSSDWRKKSLARL